MFAPLTLLVMMAAAGSPGTSDEPGRLSLWYRQPASNWLEALPVGNGRLGAMVFGGVEQERIQVNEDTIWAGPPMPENRRGAAAAIIEARRLIFAGKYREAQDLVARQVMGEHEGTRSYQPLGDLKLTFPGLGPVKNYRRWLDLETATAVTTFMKDGVTYRRTVFASKPAGVLVVRLQADRPGAISVDVGLDRPDAHNSVDRNTLLIDGQAKHGASHLGVKFDARLIPRTQGGMITSENNGLRITQADEVTLLLAAATDYHPADPPHPLERDRLAAVDAVLAAAGRSTSEELHAASAAEHRALFARVSLDLGDQERSKQPTDARLEAVRQGAVDRDLIALYAQYGRYLLICSSRPGDLPANLQGLWNEHMQAPWNADYHININIQMNYWPAEVGNLSECALPFFDFAEALLPNARTTAREVFGCGGATACHTTDVWHWTTPSGHPGYGTWPMGLAWCTQHFMEHYRFTGDRAFLRDRAYPILKEAASFFLDYLTEDPATGQLVSGPSTSPENTFQAPDGSHVSLSMGPAMDQEIIWDVFSNTLEAAQALGTSDEFTHRVESALGRLALPKIGPDGRLMEWSQPFPEPEPGHRHMSHLFAVHPGRQFSRTRSPELWAAARKSLEYRLAHGGGHTGWSRAWIINFWARFGDGDKAFENLQALLAKSTNKNLFDEHPPFQIDGNFGGCAGVLEMLLQSHEGVVQFLPAWPRAWPEGSVSGLKARGGLEVSIAWKEGKATRATVQSQSGGPAILQPPPGQAITQIRDPQGNAVAFNLVAGRASISLPPATVLTVEFQ